MENSIVVCFYQGIAFIILGMNFPNKRNFDTHNRKCYRPKHERQLLYLTYKSSSYFCNKVHKHYKYDKHIAWRIHPCSSRLHKPGRLLDLHVEIKLISTPSQTPVSPLICSCHFF